MSRLDHIDRAILGVLTEKARITWAHLAEEIGLSAPSTTERVRKLEEMGAITGYTALLNADTLGYHFLGFVTVSVSSPSVDTALREWVSRTTEVLECHVVTGSSDYLLKVRCRNARHLEQLLREDIRQIPGVGATNTTVVLSTLKEVPSVAPAEGSAPPE